MADQNQPQLSILIAVDDILLDARSWFKALCHQTLPADAYEVIIIDPSHNTDHEAALRQFKGEGWIGSNLNFYRTELGGRARALNFGIDQAKSDLLVFLGDDCQPPANFAEAHLKFHWLHDETEAVAVGIALIPSELRTDFSDWLEKSGRLFGVPIEPGMTQIQ